MPSRKPTSRTTQVADAASAAKESRKWFLSGMIAEDGPTQVVSIHCTPFQIGRRSHLALCLPSVSVSGLHAEINLRGEELFVVDLGSKNGTFVNGKAIQGEHPLDAGDLVQFADISLRVDFHVDSHGSVTAIESCYDQAFALSRFDELLDGRAVVSLFQPIVNINGGGLVAFELLGRGRLFGLESPEQMFRAAARLNRERELSLLLREEGVSAARQLPSSVRFYINTHPLELADPMRLVGSLEALRREHPDRPITVEIHEAAVIRSAEMSEFCAAIGRLNMELAYDDFGAGQARIAELAALPPDVLKFDMSLVRDIHAAGPVRQKLLENLVRLAHDAGIAALAEGIEREDEAEVCRQIGFDTGQGYLYGKPCRPRECLQYLDGASD